jgi:hypothetical protein
VNDIEKYAVTLVGAGALSYAEDDIDEEGEFDAEDDWRTARTLGLKMATAVRDNPEAFLAWYVSIVPADAS